MATATKSGQSLSFTYGYDGLRTTKTVNGVVYTYYYSGGKLMRLTYAGNTLDFFYDQNGTPFMLLHNSNIYYYITNAQGDVIRLVDINGNTAASYRYDPYGKAIAAFGSHATINPLRYRGYVFDHETGLYYLQSRYYDPEIGRFINADAYASTGQGLLSNNMFVYCLNNFINLEDTSGHLPRKNTVFVCDGAGGDIGPLGIISSDYYHELHDKNMQANEVHATGQWFDTDWPSFMTATEEGFEVVSWGLSVWRGVIYFDEEEESSVYISIGNINTYLGAHVKNGIGAEAGVGLLTVGYTGKIIDVSVDLLSLGANYMYKDGALVADASAGYYGFGIAVDVVTLIKTILGGK